MADDDREIASATGTPYVTKAALRFRRDKSVLKQYDPINFIHFSPRQNAAKRFDNKSRRCGPAKYLILFQRGQQGLQRLNPKWLTRSFDLVDKGTNRYKLGSKRKTNMMSLILMSITKTLHITTQHHLRIRRAGQPKRKSM
jgi:hypothetical protein